VKQNIQSHKNQMDVSEAVATKEVVIFDLFFTLLTTELSTDEFLATHEILGVPKSEWRKQVFNPLHARFTGAETDPFRIIQSLAHAIDPDIKDSVIREATEQRFIQFQNVLLNVPKSTISALNALREQGLKTALISNTDNIETNTWDSSPLAPLFDEVVLSWQVGFAKPNPEIYNYCLSQLSMSPEQGVFVGDGGSNELSGAKKVGLLPVFATGLAPNLTEQELLDRESNSAYVIQSLSELLLQ